MTRRRFAAQAFVNGRQVYLGRWPAQKLAHAARARALHWFSLPRAMRSHPSSPENLRREARLLEKRRNTSKFFGVSWDNRRKCWNVRLKVHKRDYNVGYFADERAAARAYDAAAAHLLGERALLNFSGTVRPASPAALKKQQRTARKERTSSRYIGVYYDAGRARPWLALLVIGETAHALGRYGSEREAAEAHDRAVRWYGPKAATLNFSRRKLSPASVTALRNERVQERKKTTRSRFIGVFPQGSGFRATICHEARHYYLGVFDTEEVAARAFDNAARRLRGTRTRLNFDPRTGHELRGARLLLEPESERERPVRRCSTR